MGILIFITTLIFATIIVLISLGILTIIFFGVQSEDPGWKQTAYTLLTIIVLISLFFIVY